MGRSRWEAQCRSLSTSSASSSRLSRRSMPSIRDSLGQCGLKILKSTTGAESSRLRSVSSWRGRSGGRLLPEVQLARRCRIRVMIIASVWAVASYRRMAGMTLDRRSGGTGGPRRPRRPTAGSWTASRNAGGAARKATTARPGGACDGSAVAAAGSGRPGQHPSAARGRRRTCSSRMIQPAAGAGRSTGRRGSVERSTARPAARGVLRRQSPGGPVRTSAASPAAGIASRA